MKCGSTIAHRDRLAGTAKLRKFLLETRNIRSPGGNPPRQYAVGHVKEFLFTEMGGGHRHSDPLIEEREVLNPSHVVEKRYDANRLAEHASDLGGWSPH